MKSFLDNWFIDGQEVNEGVDFVLIKNDYKSTGRPTEDYIVTMDMAKELCMVSLQIAEQTGREHKNVTRDIKDMLKGLELDTLKFEHIYLDSMNRKQDMFILPEREAMILASGYDGYESPPILELNNSTESRPKF